MPGFLLTKTHGVYCKARTESKYCCSLQNSRCTSCFTCRPSNSWLQLFFFRKNATPRTWRSFHNDVSLQIQNSTQVLVVVLLLQAPNSLFPIILPSSRNSLSLLPVYFYRKDDRALLLYPQNSNIFWSSHFPLSVVQLTTLLSILLFSSLSLFVGV